MMYSTETRNGVWQGPPSGYNGVGFAPSKTRLAVIIKKYRTYRWWVIATGQGPGAVLAPLARQEARRAEEAFLLLARRQGFSFALGGRQRQCPLLGVGMHACEI